MYYKNTSFEALLSEYENGNLTNLSNLSKVHSKKSRLISGGTFLKIIRTISGKRATKEIYW
jgi:hypothetical protein